MNLPEQFLNTVKHSLGESQVKEFVQSLNSNSPVSLRRNPFKFLKNSGTTTSIPWCSNGYYLNERPSFTIDPAFHAGSYYVQEASSMFLEQAILHSIDVQSPIRALDLCAAPGGKSTHLLSLLNSESLIVSNEVIRSRANILAENMVKWGNANAVVTSNDPESFARLNGYFDLMIVDAPCSGEGLFRKDPEAMNEWSPENVELCSQRQRRILSDVFPALKQKGILVYSTCTYNRKENEENLKWLISNHEVEFVPIPLKPGWGVQEVNEDGIIGYRFYPHRLQGEGFFISVMRKLESEKETIFKQKEKPKPMREVEKLNDWILNPGDFSFLQRPEGIRILPKSHSTDLDRLASELYIVKAGTLLGSFKHDKFIPDHALALSNHINRKSINSISVNIEESLQYLRKENLSLPNAPRGYSLLTYEGLGIGWINGLGNRINNLYPTNWRIRMK